MFMQIKTCAFILCVGQLLIGGLPALAMPQEEAPTNQQESPLLTIGSTAPAIDVEHWDTHLFYRRQDGRNRVDWAPHEHG